ncbi:putative ribonuclease H protein [Ananas comosus]|uniref:Putative ribonuclease H protein n=1 Tax=Ananas comosus TaxID=4615 RepID=A0A199UFG8_ANACO|nr:putative ribonuclease H protein [Ananas comosus]
MGPINEEEEVVEEAIGGDAGAAAAEGVLGLGEAEEPVERGEEKTDPAEAGTASDGSDHILEVGDKGVGRAREARGARVAVGFLLSLALRTHREQDRALETWEGPFCGIPYWSPNFSLGLMDGGLALEPESQRPEPSIGSAFWFASHKPIFITTSALFGSVSRDSPHGPLFINAPAGLDSTFRDSPQEPILSGNMPLYSGNLCFGWFIHMLEFQIFVCTEALVRDYSLTLNLKHVTSERSFYFSNVYGLPTWEGKEEFCSELLSLSAICSNSNWAICGDFNFTRNQLKRTGNTWSTRAMTMFSDLIANLAVIDLPIFNQNFTWSNMQHSPTLAKLDRFLITTEWDQAFPHCRHWLKEGDCNTKFSHAVANSRKRSNEIKHIVDDNGRQINNEAQKKSYFFNSFKRLFGRAKEEPASFGDWADLYRADSLSDPDSLTGPFTIDEVKKTTFQLGSEKAPGPDGFLLIFFQYFWETTFEWVSGLKINMNKTELYYLGTNANRAKRLTDILGCRVGNLPFRYLGLPLHIKHLRKEDWAPIISSIEMRIQGLKAKLLSHGGRIILVNSVLSNLPLFYFAIFKAPQWVLNRIESLRRAFFWKEGSKISGGSCLVGWKTICKSKREGNLGIKDMETMNKALLTKWWWHFFNERHLL